MSKPRAAQFRRAQFTWFGYTDANITHLKNLDAKTCDYLIVGFEICPKTSKPHLQGYIEFKNSVTLTAIKKKLDPALGDKSPIHIEEAKKVRTANINYCQKEESGDPERTAAEGCKWFEVIHKAKHQGKKVEKGEDGPTDQELIVAGLKAGDSIAEVVCANPMVGLGCTNNIVTLKAQIDADAMFASFKAKYPKDKPLRQWQAEFIHTVVEEPVDDRAVWWLYDERGNTGKTWLSKYLVANYGAARFENAGSKDIAFAYKGEPVVIFDFSRTTMDHLNYQIIESLKNGILFSAKYASTAKYFDPPHVICLANWKPNFGALSADRWRIHCLDDVPQELDLIQPAKPESPVESTLSPEDIPINVGPPAAPQFMPNGMGGPD